MNSFLLPVLALIIWTLLIWVLMYSRLIPHLRNHNVDSQSTRSPEGEWRSDLPEKVQYGMHNYNHLMEQPTIFYALMFFLHLSGATDYFGLSLAWAYVVLRVIHSLIQVSSNNVMARFTVFFVSTVCLIVLAIKGSLLIL